MKLCSMLCDSLDGRGDCEKTDTCVYVWLSPFAVHLKLLQHCLLINYTPIQNKKLKEIKHKKRLCGVEKGIETQTTGTNGKNR